MRYGAVSLLSLAVDALALGLLARWLGVPSVLAGSLSYLLGALVHYQLSRQYVFAPGLLSARRSAEFAAFLVTGLVGLALTAGVLAVGQALHASLALGKGVAVLTSFFVTYALRRYAVFGGGACFRGIGQMPLWRPLRGWQLAWLLLAGWTLWVTLSHEPWRDEAQDWLVVRDAADWSAFALQMRYEGHPPAWFALIKLLQWAGLGPASKGLLNWGFCAAASALVLRGMRSRPWLGLLMCASYMFAYEYTAIARCYGLTLLALCLGVASWERRGWLSMGAWLGLAALSSVYGALLASVIAGGGIVFARSIPGEVEQRWKGRAKVLLPVALALCTALWLTRDPGDRYPGELFLHWSWLRLGSVLGLEGSGMAYLPEGWPLGAWHWSSVEMGFGAVTLYFMAPWAGVWALRRVSLRSSWMFLAGFLLLCGFAYVVYGPAPRHTGFVLVLWTLCLWIGEFLGEPAASNRREEAMQWGVTLFITALNAAVGLWSGYQEIRHPFSPASQAGEYIASQLNQSGAQMSGDAVWTDGDAQCAQVLLSAGLRGVHFQQGDRVGTYVRWDKGRALLGPVPTGEAMPEVQWLIVTNPKTPVGDSFVLVREFKGGVGSDEQFWIYRRR